MLHQVDNKLVDQFVEHVRLTHKPAKATATELSTYTLAGYVRVIIGFLHWCQDDQQFSQHVQAVTIQRIKKPKVIETTVQPFTAAQVEALFKACSQEESEHLQLRDRAILALLLDSGVRANELVTLQIRNISLDPKDSYVRVLGKGGKWGEVGIGDEARRHVQKYIRLFREPTIEHEIEGQVKNISPRQAKQIAEQVKQHALLIVNRSGKPLTTRGLWRTIVRLGGWAGIEGVRCSPHTFRHTFAVLFWRRTKDIRTLSKLLRHSSITVTENYLKSILQSEARIGAPSVLDEL
jgi:integrase/recombinase XerD